MNRLINFLFILISWGVIPPTLAMEGKEELYLVVGSNRAPGDLKPWIEKLYKSEGQDFTHVTTFGGKATTMDLLPCKLKTVPHIQGDAKTYRFEDPIKAIFMELFPTDGNQTIKPMKKIYHPKDEKKDKGQEILNMSTTMALALENLAPQIVAGGTLEIEYDPGLIMIPDLKFYCLLKGGLAALNPFEAMVSPINYEIFEIWLTKNPSEYSQCLNEIKLKLAENNQELEPEKLEYLIADAQYTLLYLQPAFTSLCAALSPLKPESLQKRLQDELAIYKKRRSKEMFDILNYLFGLLLQEVHRHRYKGEIEEYLKYLNFEDIDMRRVEINPYNGRRNSWMIRAKKV